LEGLVNGSLFLSSISKSLNKFLGSGKSLTVFGVGSGAAKVDTAKNTKRTLLEYFMAAVEG